MASIWTAAGSTGLIVALLAWVLGTLTRIEGKIEALGERITRAEARLDALERRVLAAGRHGE